MSLVKANAMGNRHSQLSGTQLEVTVINWECLLAASGRPSEIRKGHSWHQLQMLSLQIRRAVCRVLSWLAFCLMWRHSPCNSSVDQLILPSWSPLPFLFAHSVLKYGTLHSGQLGNLMDFEGMIWHSHLADADATTWCSHLVEAKQIYDWSMPG